MLVSTTYFSVTHPLLKFLKKNQLKLKLKFAKLSADMELKQIDECGSSSSHSHTSLQ